MIVVPSPFALRPGNVNANRGYGCSLVNEQNVNNNNLTKIAWITWCKGQQCPLCLVFSFSAWDFLMQDASFPHVVSCLRCPFVGHTSWTSYYPAKYCNVSRSIPPCLCDAHGSANSPLGSFGSTGCTILGGSWVEFFPQQVPAVSTGLPCPSPC